MLLVTLGRGRHSLPAEASCCTDHHVTQRYGKPVSQKGGNRITLAQTRRVVLLTVPVPGGIYVIAISKLLELASRDGLSYRVFPFWGMNREPTALLLYATSTTFRDT
jgi:hypothetical protein